MNLKNKNVLVYGLSISGEWVAKLLIKKKAKVFLFDDEKKKKTAVPNTYIINELNTDLICRFDFIVLSPSIPKTNIWVEKAKAMNIKIMSEIEFASLFVRHKNLLAITGTNGKTTTVELTSMMLNKKTIACGNIGYPLSRAVLEKSRHTKVVEVSSFMLENAKEFSPFISTILNIEPDHLIRHKTIEEYTETKLNIFANLKPDDYAIINLDNKISPQKSSLTLTYSQKRLADVYLKNGAIYYHSTKIVNLNEMNLKGKHNVYNVMCAICFAIIKKVSIPKIRQAIIEFTPDKYRIELTKRINEINFYNDSKSTNIASTLASVETVKGAIILLLGGSKKGLDYEQLFEKMTKRVKHIFAFGEIADDLEKANNNKFKLIKCDNLNHAFDQAVRVAKKNDSVLLSPASASYDEFSNYIERGKAFDKKVMEYETKTAKR